MNEIEKDISDMLSKRRDKPVLVEICGEIENAAEVRRILAGAAAKSRPAARADEKTISIPVGTYRRLVYAGAQLDMLREAYCSGVLSWKIAGYMKLMFDQKDEPDTALPASTPEPEPPQDKEATDA